jgi:hypothetical protein
VTLNITPTTGVEAFVAALEAFDVGPVVEPGLVLYTIVPVSGALAGQPVRTGVLLDEVAPWPTTPPHWIHLPVEITFSATNMSGSPKPGWRSHSREIKGWGTAPSLAAAWLALVRGVLSGAQ